jgi:hypothetical protein
LTIHTQGQQLTPRLYSNPVYHIIKPAKIQIEQSDRDRQTFLFPLFYYLLSSSSSLFKKKKNSIHIRGVSAATADSKILN